MIAKYLLPAVAAIGSVAAQGNKCSEATATINSPADASGIASCSTYKGNIIVGPQFNGDLDLTGIEKLQGDLNAENVEHLSSVGSSTLTSISGAFTLKNTTAVQNIKMGKLNSVGTISWVSVSKLDTLEFGTPGITKADEVEISDSFLDTLDGIDLRTVKNLNLNNNGRLVKFASSLETLSGVFIVQANGENLQLSIPNLVWAANLTIANVSSLELPSLEVVNGSARFDSNSFKSFIAPNLTSTKSGDISFVGNSQLTNLSAPAMTSIGGGLLIANNTALRKLDGFPKVKSIFGAVKLRGSFDTVDFPKLADVRGSFDASSTNDMDSSCDALKKLAPSSSGGGGQIRGSYSCTSFNKNANQDTGRNTTGGSDDNAAAGVGINTALLSLAIVSGLAALL